MRITIRIYKRHDLDLLALYCADSSKFKKEFKETLKKYIKNTPTKNLITETECKPVSSLPTKASFHLLLKEEDEDIKNWIKGITRGRRNNIMKNIYRNSLPIIDSPYFSDSEIQSFTIRSN